MEYSATRKCPKCGGPAVTSKYNSELDVIVKKCLRCSYSWDEQPLDGPSVSKGA